MREISVLFLSYDGLTDPLGSSQIMPYLLNLSQKNIRFSVISFEKDERFKKKGNKVKAQLDAVSVNWYPLQFTAQPPVYSKFKDLQRFKSFALKTAQSGSFEIIHCRSYVAAEAGIHVKKSTGLPVIFDTRGFWVDERIDKHIWNLSNPLMRAIYHWYRKKERTLYRMADTVLTLTNKGKEIITLTWDIENHLVARIPCASNPEEFTITTPKRKVMAKKALGIAPETLCLGYLGSLGGWYDLSNMLIFFKALSGFYPHPVFVFYTPDSPQLIKKAFKNAEMDPSASLVRFIDKSALNGALDAFDLSILFLENGKSISACSPTRIGELWLKGIPVIISKGIGDLDDIYRENDLGTVYDTHGSWISSLNKQDLDKYLSTSPDLLRHLAQKHYNFAEAVDQYLHIYKNMTK